MCIIAIKCKGVKLPDEQTLKTMWTNNPHGAGIMYARDGKVFIDKGYMDWTAFHERIKSLGDLTDTPLIMHFRIATHGSVIPGNTHPFPVSSNVMYLTKLRLACKVGVAHNGIIPITPRQGISDTMEFIASELAPMAAKQPDWYKRERVLEGIGKRIQSKLAVLDSAGVISYYGDFITEGDGMLYSNTSYKPRAKATSIFYDAEYMLDDTDYSSMWERDLQRGTPPWKSGRKSVWLKPVLDTDAYDIDGACPYDEGDIEDMWCDCFGNVYMLDYDNAIAYKLSGCKTRRSPGASRYVFNAKDGIRFEYAGEVSPRYFGM